MRLAPWALLLVSLLWGTTFVAVKTGLDDASPLLFVGIRFALAAATSALLLRRTPGLRRALIAGAPLGIVLAISYSAQTIGLDFTTPARSGFVTGLNVALVPLWAAVVLRNRPRPLSLLGLAIALPGLWLLTSPGTDAWNVGDAWTVLCAVFFALHVVLLNRVGERFEAAGLLVSQLTVTAVLCLGASAAFETPRIEWTPKLGLALALTAIFATTGTTWLQLRFQPKVEPTRAALIYTTEPVFAALFSWLLFAERLPATGWIGGGLIVLGMVLAEVASGAPSPRPAESESGA